jgi:hypothetical protein
MFRSTMGCTGAVLSLFMGSLPAGHAEDPPNLGPAFDIVIEEARQAASTFYRFTADGNPRAGEIAVTEGVKSARERAKKEGLSISQEFEKVVTDAASTAVKLEHDKTMGGTNSAK